MKYDQQVMKRLIETKSYEIAKMKIHIEELEIENGQLKN